MTRPLDVCRFSAGRQGAACAWFAPEVFQPRDFWGRPLGAPRLVCAHLEAAGPLDSGPFYARCEVEREARGG